MSKNQWQPTLMRQLLRQWITRLQDIWRQHSRRPQFPAIEGPPVRLAIEAPPGPLQPYGAAAAAAADASNVADNGVEKDVDQLWEEMAIKLNEMIAKTGANQLQAPPPANQPVVQLEMKMNPMVAKFFNQLDEQLANAQLAEQQAGIGKQEQGLVGAVGGVPQPPLPQIQEPFEPDFQEHCPICRRDDDDPDNDPDRNPIVYPCICPAGYHLRCLNRMMTQDRYVGWYDGLRTCPVCRRLINYPLFNMVERRPTRAQFHQYLEQRYPGGWQSVQRKLERAARRCQLFVDALLPVLLTIRHPLITLPVFYICLIGCIALMVITGMLSSNWLKQYRQFLRHWNHTDESLPLLDFIDFNMSTGEYQSGIVSQYDPLPERRLQQPREELQDIEEQISLVMADLADNYAQVDQLDEQQQQQYHERHQVLNYWRDQRERLLREWPDLRKYQ